MTQDVFSACVALLMWLAGLCGMTYEAVNVLVFCVLWPALTVALIILLVIKWK